MQSGVFPQLLVCIQCKSTRDTADRFVKWHTYSAKTIVHPSCSRGWEIYNEKTTYVVRPSHFTRRGGHIGCGRRRTAIIGGRDVDRWTDISSAPESFLLDIALTAFICRSRYEYEAHLLECFLQDQIVEYNNENVTVPRRVLALLYQGTLNNVGNQYHQVVSS